MGNQYQYFSKVALTILGAMLISTSNQSFADTKQKLLKAADTEASGNYVRTRFLQQIKKPFNQHDPRKKLLLIGDSHAQDFYNVILENNVSKDYQISNRYIPNVCQMYLGEDDISEFRDEKNASICEKSDTLALAKQQVAHADVIILAANWKAWAAKRLPVSIENLQLTPEQSLLVIGRKSFGKPNIRKYLRMSEDQLKMIRNRVDEHQVAINRLMKSSIPGNVFVDVQSIVCRSPNTCRIFTDDAELISFDGGHLTPEGARYVGEVLFEQAPLKDLFVSNDQASSAMKE